MRHFIKLNLYFWQKNIDETFSGYFIIFDVDIRSGKI